MKMMFQTFIACTSELIHILNESAKIQDPVDIKEVVSRFTTDVIGSCAFGIECNSLKNPESEFRVIGKRIFSPPSSFLRKLRVTLVSLLPPIVIKLLEIKLMDKDIEKFFMGMVNDTVNYREKNQVKRNDFMQLLLQLKNEGKIDDDDSFTKNGKDGQDKLTLTINELAAQCFVFFLAGFETSATTMTFALLELALNQDMQEKLRNDIEQVLSEHNGALNYDAVIQMSYLDKVIQGKLFPHSYRLCEHTAFPVLIQLRLSDMFREWSQPSGFGLAAHSVRHRELILKLPGATNHTVNQT